MNEEPNPYRPPVAQVQEASQETSMSPRIAGKGRRFCTWLVDYLGFIVLSMLVGGMLGLLFGSRATQYLQGGWSYLFGFVVMGVYYVFFEGLWGRTPGKLILGTRVTDMDGNEPALRAVVKRTLARFVPFEGLTFFGERGFHDRVSRTRVIRTR